MKFEYEGYFLEITKECSTFCYSTKSNLKGFNTLRANVSLGFLINHFVQEVDNQKDKSMDVKCTLWDAVEHNTQIELLLTQLDFKFKTEEGIGEKE